MAKVKKKNMYLYILLALFLGALITKLQFQSDSGGERSIRSVLQKTAEKIAPSLNEGAVGFSATQNTAPSHHSKNSPKTSQISDADSQEQLSAREKTARRILSRLSDDFGKNLPENIDDVIDNIYDEGLAELNLFESFDESQLLAEVYEYVEVWDLENIGYFDSMALDEYDRDTIASMAESGDVSAIQNMADHYYFDQHDLEVEALSSSKAQAKTLYKKALAMGSVRSASIMAEINIIENNTVEAYAWYSISKTLGDHRHANWFEKLGVAKTMDAETIVKAEQMAASLKQELYNLSMELNADPDAFAASGL